MQRFFLGGGMKKILCLLTTVSLVCILLVGCTNNIKYELVCYPLGAPYSEDDYKTQMFKYNSLEEFETGAAKYYLLNNDSENEYTVDEKLFTNAFLVHVAVCHTFSDVPKINNISKTDNSVTVEIRLIYPNDIRADDIVFTHYLIKFDRTELSFDDNFILKGNYII